MRTDGLNHYLNKAIVKQSSTLNHYLIVHTPFVICTQLTEYYTTMCCHLPKKAFWKIRCIMRRFFLNLWFNSLVLRIQRSAKSLNTNCKFLCRPWAVKYNINCLHGSGWNILLPRCEKMLMAKLKLSLLSCLVDNN